MDKEGVFYWIAIGIIFGVVVIIGTVFITLFFTGSFSSESNIDDDKIITCGTIELILDDAGTFQSEDMDASQQCITNAILGCKKAIRTVITETSNSYTEVLGIIEGVCVIKNTVDPYEGRISCLELNLETNTYFEEIECPSGIKG